MDTNRHTHDTPQAAQPEQPYDHHPEDPVLEMAARAAWLYEASFELFEQHSRCSVQENRDFLLTRVREAECAREVLIEGMSYVRASTLQGATIQLRLAVMAADRLAIDDCDSKDALIAQRLLRLVLPIVERAAGLERDDYGGDHMIIEATDDTGFTKWPSTTPPKH